MKKYCKNTDILDRSLVVRAILTCLDTRKKRLRYDTVRLFANTGNVSKFTARQALEDRNELFGEIVYKLADSLIAEMKRGALRLRPVANRDRADASSGKTRTIAIIHVKQLIYDHIAVAALAPLMARIGRYQCASLPQRGQLFGAKAVERWLRDRSIKYAAKLDIRHCYESIDHGRMMDFLKRHVKNPRLLWLIDTLIATCPQGLHIGSYLSQTLCNIYLSELYHEISERMTKTRRHRNGSSESVNLVRHVLFYMDDILILGHNKKHLHEAVRRVIGYASDKLGLQIKPGWSVFCVSESEGVDMMGFRMFRGHTSIRRRVFRRLRRAVLRIERRCVSRVAVPISLARRMASYAGYLMHSDSVKFCKRYHVARVLRVVASVMSTHDRRRAALAA